MKLTQSSTANKMVSGKKAHRKLDERMNDPINASTLQSKKKNTRRGLSNEELSKIFRPIEVRVRLLKFNKVAENLYESKLVTDRMVILNQFLVIYTTIHQIRFFFKSLFIVIGEAKNNDLTAPLQTAKSADKPVLSKNVRQFIENQFQNQSEEFHKSGKLPNLKIGDAILAKMRGTHGQQKSLDFQIRTKLSTATFLEHIIRGKSEPKKLYHSLLLLKLFGLSASEIRLVSRKESKKSKSNLAYQTEKAA